MKSYQKILCKFKDCDFYFNLVPEKSKNFDLFFVRDGLY